MRFHKSPVVAGVKHAYYSSGAAPGQGKITITVRRAGLTPTAAPLSRLGFFKCGIFKAQFLRLRVFG